jgi:hypothetical protein
MAFSDRLGYGDDLVERKVMIARGGLAVKEMNHVTDAGHKCGRNDHERRTEELLDGGQKLRSVYHESIRQEVEMARIRPFAGRCNGFDARTFQNRTSGVRDNFDL